jgi:O-antigen ligase
VLFAAKALFLALAFSIPISQPLTYLCVVGLLLCTALLLVQRRPNLRQVDPFVWMTLALLGWITLATLWSSGSRTEIINEWSRYLPLLIVPIFFIVDSRSGAGVTPGSGRRGEWLAHIGHTPLGTLVMQGFMAAMALTVVLTLAKHADLLGPVATWLPANDRSVFRYYIVQGVMSSLFVALCLSVWARTKSRPLRYASLCFAILAALSIVWVLATRTALLTLALSIFLLPMLARRRWLAAGTAAAVIVVAGVAAVVTSSESLMRMQDTFRTLAQTENASLAPPSMSDPSQATEASTQIRWQYLQGGLALGAQAPWAGHGTGSFLSEFCWANGRRWCEIAQITSAQPHNQFVLFLTEQGLVGVLLFAAWLATPLLRSRRSAASSTNRAGPFAQRRAAIYACACLVGTSVLHALFDSTLHLSTEGILYPLLLAASMSWFADRQ